MTLFILSVITIYNFVNFILLEKKSFVQLLIFNTFQLCEIAGRSERCN